MMNQQEILKKIGRIIQELQDQQLYLSQTENISLLELELFNANADFLIDHIEILKKLNHQDDVLRIEPNPPIELQIIEEETKTEENLAELEEIQEIEIVDESIEVEKPVFDFSFEEEPSEMVFDFEKKLPVEEVFDRALSSEEIEVLQSKTKALEEISEIVDENNFDEEEEGPEPFLIIKEINNDELPIVHEKVKNIEPIIPIKEKTIKAEVKEPKLTLNEMLSAQKELKQNNIKSGKSTIDLKTVISLNDKMIFIKDLFNGYNLAYSEAVEIINRLESFEAADNFLLKNYAKKNNWADKNEVVDRLYEYLNRKFGS